MGNSPPQAEKIEIWKVKKVNSYLFFSEILNSYLEKLIPTYFLLKSLIPTNCSKFNSSQTQNPKIFRLRRAISHCKILFSRYQIAKIFRLRRAFPLQKLWLRSTTQSDPSYDPIRSSLPNRSILRPDQIIFLKNILQRGNSSPQAKKN